MSCDIPIRKWLLVYFINQLMQKLHDSFSQKLDQSERLHDYRRTKKYLKRLTFICIELFDLAWILYGSSLYFSGANNCSRENTFMNYLMFILIIIGYFRILIYLFVFCFLVFLYAKSYQAKSHKQIMTVNIIKAL